MKLRFASKTPHETNLDRLLFECVGNGKRYWEQFSQPDLLEVKQLIREGATIDHFLFTPALPEDDGETTIERYNNCIAMGCLLY